jgi:Ribonuclease G/E
LLTEHLIPEVQVSNPEYKILRRRIAILVGQWAVIEESSGSRPIYYQLYQFLLNPEDPINDQVVRVAAGRQLYFSVNAFEATVEEFLPYIDNIMDRLMSLVEEVQLDETKVSLLQTINVIVNRMEHHVSLPSE